MTAGCVTVIVSQPQRVVVRVAPERVRVSTAVAPGRVVVKALPERVVRPAAPQRVVRLAQGPQGPAGAPGPAGADGQGLERALAVDIAGPRYHYVRRAGDIVRIDYAFSPAQIARTTPPDTAAAWPGRAALTYL